MLVDIITELTGERSVDASARIMDLGIDSVKSVVMVLEIEERLGLRPSISQLMANPTVVELAASLVDEARPATTSAGVWVQPRPRGAAAAIQLFCFHHVGGGASFFTPWSKLLGPRIDVLPVQLPGREERSAEPPYVRFDALIADLASALPSMITGPFAFFGHSLGGGIAAALAERLRQTTGLSPAHLFVSATRAPSRLTTLPAIDRENLGDFLDVPDHVMTSEDFVRTLLDRVQADVELVNSMSAVVDDRFRTNVTITAFAGSRDTLVPPDAVQAWSENTPALAFHVFDGGHMFVNDHVEGVLALVHATLTRDLT
ncbi:MAG: alpha/beta fold hydrolase [Proteobacteria bacterium]|nr:alpha/beta fold hydrolase [Pseudomonadota bacterium]